MCLFPIICRSIATPEVIRKLTVLLPTLFSPHLSSLSCQRSSLLSPLSALPYLFCSLRAAQTLDRLTDASRRWTRGFINRPHTLRPRHLVAPLHLRGDLLPSPGAPVRVRFISSGIVNALLTIPVLLRFLLLKVINKVPKNSPAPAFGVASLLTTILFCPQGLSKRNVQRVDNARRATRASLIASVAWCVLTMRYMHSLR